MRGARLKLYVIGLLAIGILVPVSGAYAMLAAECADIKYIDSQATVIVEAEVSDVRVKKEAEGQVFTYVTVDVKKYLRGEGPVNLIIKQFGGSYDQDGDTYTIAVSETAVFQVGDKGTLYLQQPDTPFYAGKYFTTVCATGMMDNASH